jgi:hypothetical protein
MRFQLNSPDVIQETIEGEVIVVHLVSGSYYSLLGSGVALWNGLLAGMDAQELAATFTPPADPDAISAFVAELEQEQLLVPAAGPPSATDSTLLPAASGTAFSTPMLQKFSDMQELLLVDPIHEVKPQGWPVVKPKAEPEA